MLEVSCEFDDVWCVLDGWELAHGSDDERGWEIALNVTDVFELVAVVGIEVDKHGRDDDLFHNWANKDFGCDEAAQVSGIFQVQLNFFPRLSPSLNPLHFPFYNNIKVIPFIIILNHTIHSIPHLIIHIQNNP